MENLSWTVLSRGFSFFCSNFPQLNVYEPRTVSRRAKDLFILHSYLHSTWALAYRIIIKHSVYLNVCAFAGLCVYGFIFVFNILFFCYHCALPYLQFGWIKRVLCWDDIFCCGVVRPLWDSQLYIIRKVFI